MHLKPPDGWAFGAFRGFEVVFVVTIRVVALACLFNIVYHSFVVVNIGTLVAMFHSVDLEKAFLWGCASPFPYSIICQNIGFYCVIKNALYLGHLFFGAENNLHIIAFFNGVLCAVQHFRRYNTKRLHSSLDYMTPEEVYFGL